MMTCEWCGEVYGEAELYLTKCGLNLCPLCRDDHDRQPCPECTQEAGYEAADYDWDKARDR